MSTLDTMVSLRCATPGCKDVMRLQQVTQHVTFGLEGGHLTAALTAAGVHLGWRRNLATTDTHCPRHVHELRLVCVICLGGLCSCEHGPRFEARPASEGTPTP